MADNLFSSEPVSLRAWEPDDLELLRAMNTDVMWAHLGGPEKSAKVMARHYRYLVETFLSLDMMDDFRYPGENPPGGLPCRSLGRFPG